ncbi:hypothetical protein CG716_24295 [Mycolicibacterium sphagni]|uniref:Uncharacterized protein n=1 Tax=Mycolicibacterium sphagni TaxID=1786 RepID=A0A255DFM6_9MYCO|nr:hypothetical protein [Mycolicibacterium sphagni]OYN75752.1 hypothetical protein CG716_24295 [Mycolicibacterium sphagni]
MRLTHIAAGAAIAGGLAASALGLGAATASADPGWTPPGPAQPALPPAAPQPASAPAWAPPKPVQPAWSNGNPQVWDAGWNHWGVWVNNVFVPTF